MEERGALGADEARDLLELLTEPSPAMYVRMVLCLYRRRGWIFERAWAQALRSLPRKDVPDIDAWRSRLHRDKDLWRMAYDARLEDHDEHDGERSDSAGDGDPGEVSGGHGRSLRDAPVLEPL